jgi:hypothetical protein
MTESQARQELQAAWNKVQEHHQDGLEFGKICCKWRDWYLQKPKDKGDRIRFLWKSMGIPHTAAYRYMDIYEESVGLKKPIEVERYTEEELRRNEQRAANETRLERLFRDCGFQFYVRQNCATNEPHFNVVFSALNEAEVRTLAEKLGGGVWES